MNCFRLFPAVAGLVVFLVTNSTPAQTQQPPAPAQVMRPSVENFQVGPSVFVRSLAYDKKRNALWVGTSVGALEIGLHDNAVKNTFTRKDGLANEYVFAIGIDPAGPVWFGTNAGGTSSYADGKWKTYFPMHGLADYWVYAFAFDKAGNIWMGTWNGASLFDVNTGKFTNFRDELINIWVYGIDIDSKGRVWFGTEGGVSMFDRGKWRSWTHDDGLGAKNFAQLPASQNTGLGTRSRHDLSVQVQGTDSYNPNYVFSVLVDGRDDSIWFGTWGGGVSHFDGSKKWTSLTKKDGLAGNVVYSIAQDADGVLWFGTNQGISRYDGNKWRTFTHRDGLIGDHIYAIAITPGNAVWAASKGGVTRLGYGK